MHKMHDFDEQHALDEYLASAHNRLMLDNIQYADPEAVCSTTSSIPSGIP